MNRKPKVFVIHDDLRRSFRQAEEFGELVPLVTGRYDSFFQNSEEFAERVNELLEENEYNAHDDYLLINGEPILTAIATTAALSQYSIVNYLRWDRMGQRYNPVTIDYSAIV